MDSIVIMPHWIIDCLAVLGVVFGFMIKGIVMAIAGEKIFRPIAHYLERKAEDWEETHPELLHFLNDHPGLRPSRCDECQNQ